MRKDSLDFLKRLLATPSPSGYEQAIQKVCHEYAEPFVDEIRKDVHGNQYHVLNADAPVRIMLAGHVDEIGLMVNAIDNDGFIRFVPVGGVDIATLPGQRVEVHGAKGPVPGVIGRKAIHLTPEEDRKRMPEFHTLWIDIGANGRKDAEKLVAIGDCITMAVGYQELRDDKIVARALDDRIGAFVVLEALRILRKRKFNVAVYGVTTVQEEIGLRGATTSAYGCKPHAGLAVDVAWATDHPNGDGDRYGHAKLHGGPILSRGPNINPVVQAGLEKAAKKHDIPYQVRAMPRGTGTDANAMQLSHGGVATALIGVPNRYMHTPVEMVSTRDVAHCSQLIAEWICALKGDETFIP